jgi:hypothetical protein
MSDFHRGFSLNAAHKYDGDCDGGDNDNTATISTIRIFIRDSVYLKWKAGTQQTASRLLFTSMLVFSFSRHLWGWELAQEGVRMSLTKLSRALCGT